VQNDTALLPEPGDHRLVFIAGLHRSGTSFFHKALQQHPDVSGFSDTGVPEDEGQHLQSVYPPGMAFGGPGRFAFHPGAYLNETSALCSSESAARLFADWAPFWDLGKPVLIEKSPTNLLKTRLLQGLFPNSWFIIILRHPIAVTLATIKYSGASLEEALQHWVHAHSIFFDQDRSHLRKVLVIRYEDLVTDTARIADCVFHFAGLTRIQPVISIDTSSNPRYFAQWDELCSQQRKPMEHIIARFSPPLERFGYSLREPAQLGAINV
jgi:hypothetical protein